MGLDCFCERHLLRRQEITGEEEGGEVGTGGGRKRLEKKETSVSPTVFERKAKGWAKSCSRKLEDEHTFLQHAACSMC